MTTAHTRRDRKPARRPLAGAKPPKRKLALKSESRHGTLDDPKAQFTNDEWHEMVATAAYFRAESRGFEGGSPEDDWCDAEAELREQMASAEDSPDWTESPDTTDADVERSGE